MLRLQPGADSFIEGYTLLLSYMEAIERVALSYHTKVGILLREEAHRDKPFSSDVS
jgi:hypothetical protein